MFGLYKDPTGKNVFTTSHHSMLGNVIADGRSSVFVPEIDTLRKRVKELESELKVRFKCNIIITY